MFFVKVIFCVCTLNLLVSKGLQKGQHIWHSYQYETGRSNREELVVRNVKADEQFNYGYNVHSWKSLTVANSAYAVGITSNGITILNAKLKDKIFYSNRNIEFNSTPVDITLMEIWDAFLKRPEVILVVSFSGFDPRLIWFKITHDNTLEEIWAWNLYKEVKHMNYFKFDGQDYLLLITEHKNNKNIDLYKFQIGSRNPQNFWLLNSIKLRESTTSSTINTFGSDCFISIPQKQLNMIYIYKFSENYLQLYQNISSPHADKVTSFKIGFRSFLAVNGWNAGIFEFTRYDLKRSEIEPFNIDNIDFWFPIQVKTYRDEVILLLQRSLLHASHTSFLVEALMFDGTKFIIHDEISCSFYGENENGLACLVDEESDSGLLGSAVLSLGNTLGLLVPRNNLPSGLFQFTTEMKDVISPVEAEIQKILSTKLKLEKMLDDREEKLKTIKERLDNSLKMGESNIISAPWKIHTLSSPIAEEDQSRLKKSISDPDLEDLEKKLSTVDTKLKVAEQKLNFTIPLGTPEHHLQRLIVNGVVEVHGGSFFENTFVNYLNGQEASGLLSDIVNVKINRVVEGAKTFKKLDVEVLKCNFINKIPADKILYNDNEKIQIQGNLVFEDEVKVHGAFLENVNQINIQEEIIHSNKLSSKSLDFEHIQVIDLFAENLNKILLHKKMQIPEDQTLEFLQIPNNLTVESINGQNFTSFYYSLCLKNIPSFIPGHTFIQTIDVDTVQTDTLNNLEFPQGYASVLTNFTLTGIKSFKSLIASDVIAEEFVNNINTSNVVSLTKDQKFNENFVFHNLEVLKNFGGEPKVFGPHVSEILPNPVITETNELKGNVIFKNLEVDGAIIIEEDFNKNNFDQVLQDVLYKNKENQRISSLKEFPNGFTINNGLNINSNSINSIPLDTFVTKDTDQTLIYSTINGNITIENLLLNGLYEDINIWELEKEMVKLDGEQYISSKIIFDNNNLLPDITATDFHITKTLDGLEENEFLYSKGDRIFANLNLKEMHTELLTVKGKTVGKLEEINLDEFDSRRLSLSRKQTITAPFTVNNSKINSLEANLINDLPYSKLFNFNSYVEEIAEKLIQGRIKIKGIYTNNSVNVDLVNGQRLMLEKTNATDVIFQGNVHFTSLDLKNYNGDDLNQLQQNMIFKNETNVKIVGNKAFFNDFVVNHLLSPEEINGINVDDILMKRGNQQMAGPLLIIGNVTVEKDVITKMLNDVPMDYLQSAYRKDGDTFIINDDVFFNRLLQTTNLYVENYVNNVKIREFIKNMVLLNSDDRISNITFLEPVHFENNLQITEEINNFDLSDFINDVVFITSDETIEGNLIFTEPVHVTGHLFVENVEAELISGINLTNWKNNTLFINQGFIPGKLNFESITIHGNAIIDHINDIEVSTLINLKSDERINATLNIDSIKAFNNISVKHLVNGYKLQPEFDNTLMVTSDEIYSNITFLGNVLIRNNLNVIGLTNNKNLSNLVTTSTDQNLTASYKFNTKCIFESKLDLDGNLNNQNFNIWSENVIKTNLPDQTINTIWDINQNVIFNNDISGNGLLGGIDVKNASEEMSERSITRYTSQKTLIENYKNACKDVNYILNRAKNQVHKFMYFESMQYLEFKSNIEYVHFFKFQSQSYLFISESSNCLLYLYRWSKGIFELISETKVGSISQIVSVHDGDLIFFIIKTLKTSLRCKVEGTTFWSFNNKKLQFLQKLEHSILLQESLLPGRFYTLKDDSVTEYVIENNLVNKYRKWKTDLDNLAFVPRGLATGLSLRNGQQLLRLSRDDPVMEDEFDEDTDTYLIGNVTKEVNTHLPGRNQGEVIVLNVGAGDIQKTLVAVSSHETTSIKGRLDFIKIFEDVLTGRVFHKVVANNPSSLTSLEFGDSGESLLVFLENGKVLQVYQYKGIEGFKHKSSINVEGSKIITMTLLLDSTMEQVFLGIINNNRFNIIRSVMTGNQLEEDNLYCEF